MNYKCITTTLLILATITVSAQTAIWQDKGRIAISSDGNEHDNDDWAATPLSLALIAAKGLQDKLVLYTYSDHIWGSNKEMGRVQGMNGYEQMKESALGGAREFDFDQSRFICAVDDPESAYNALKDQINASTKENPLIIIAAGPMQVVGEAINRSNIDSRKYISVVSHSTWNDRHANHPYIKNTWDQHSGWTFDQMKKSFGTKDGGSAKFIKILDQNSGDDYEGLYTGIERYDWIKTSTARNNPAYRAGSWDWLYKRMSTCIKNGKNFDPSDSGLIIYMFTGIEKTNPDMAREIMENPISK